MLKNILLEKNLFSQSYGAIKIVSILKIIFLFTVIHLLVALLKDVRFSPDSWSYLELSKNIFHDFYRINTYRHFQNDIPYGMSFPPLWPMVIAAVNAVTGLGIYTGYFVNFLVVVLIALITERTTRRSFGFPGVGLLSISILLWYAPFVDEVTGARSVPLTLLWLALLLHLFTSDGAGRKRVAFAMGLVAGLVVMTRFDFLLATFALVFPYTLLKRRFSSAAAYLAGWLAAVSPWIIYSIRTFGVAFATDNGRVARAAQPDYVTNFLLHPLPTISDAPVQWLMKCMHNLEKMLFPVNYNTVVFVIVVAQIFVILIIFTTKWKFLEYFRSEDNRSKQLNFLGFGVMFLVQAVGPIITGYPDSRYFAPIVWMSTIIAAMILPSRSALINISGCIFVLLIGTNINTLNKNDYREYDLSLKESNRNPVEFNSLKRCLRSDSGILFLDTNLAFKFGALTGYRVSFLPPNFRTLNRLERQIFMARFKLRYVAALDDPDRARAHRLFNLLPIKGCESQAFEILSVKPQ